RETLQRHIKTNLEVLYSLANFFRGSQKVERAEFRTFVEESFVRHPDIFALQWWPRVLRRERRAFERAVRAEGFRDFYIKDAARPDAFVRAPERSEYFPILYSEPQDKDPLALGWDLVPQMQPLWARLLGMQQAAGAATAVASGGVELYQKERDANDPYAVVLYLPVYRHARVPEDEAGRLRDLRGFVVEILRVRDLFQNALHGYALPGIDMVLLDETPGATVIELYHHRSRLTPVPDPQGWKQLSGMRWKATVELADRRLSVLYLATPEYQRAHPPWGAWTVSTTLMVVLSLTSGFLGSSLRRTQRSQGMARALAEEIAQREEARRLLERAREELEARVAERTRELREANEQLQQLDRLKSEFLATMSHELRTPLNSIIGFTGILKQGIAGDLNPEQHRQIAMVYGSAKHLLTLINDLLDLSRIESGRVEIQREPFRCEDVIAEVIASLAPALAGKALKLVSDIPAPLPEVRSDRKRIFQIVLNLASNGVKFTEQGEVRIHCVAEGEALMLSVTDTGIGIKPENMALLFEAFRQVEGSARRRYEGAGLGLHLSRRLARLLGGDIRAESAYGKGSRFTLSLPLGVG
ncbi:MAG: CHASE domain-containing protein, partial [Gammaproteobacteria bacterium]